MEGRRRGCELEGQQEEEEEEDVVVCAMVWSISSRVVGCRYRGTRQTRIGAQP